MANIMCRQANNDLEALQTAQGMENAGANVFSISHAGMRQPDGAMIPSAQYVVWAKYEPPVTTEHIDMMISRELYGDEV